MVFPFDLHRFLEWSRKQITWIFSIPDSKPILVDQTNLSKQKPLRIAAQPYFILQNLPVTKSARSPEKQGFSGKSLLTSPPND